MKKWRSHWTNDIIHLGDIMRGNLSDQLFEIMEEKIYVDLELHVLQKRLIKAEEEDKKGFVEHLNKIILKLLQDRKMLNLQLRDNGIKLHEAVDYYDIEGGDSIFVDYYYSQKVNGGYKEGTLRFWKAGIKLKLKKRMKDYFVGQ